MKKQLITVLAVFASPSCSSAQPTLDTASGTSFAVGERPRAITTADFNGDGRIDIAVANADSDSVSILLQQEDGAFSRVDYPAGNEPADIADADIDGDGSVDLVVANHETSSVTIIINSGDGSFTEAERSPFNMAARPHLHSVAVADFNDDGFIDIASDSSDSDSISVMFGKSNGFEPSIQANVGEFPYYRLGILPSETGTRVLVPSPRANRVSQLDLSSGLALAVIGDARGAVMARSANLDNDGVADVVAIMGDGVVMWSQVDGRFSKLESTPVAFDDATELATGDLDGDGRDEIIVGLWGSDQIQILSHDGKRLGKIQACFRPAALEIADLNGDQKGEVIAGCWNGSNILIFDGSTILPAS
ncbi:FG-GAP repeat domain-containing protein [Pontixanthobacter aquaemixtae]|uniref:FG-GAP repeat domain-containing protein n=1 Tax=Pontixanthobacter aquaemixtae TaxID=1958940 RepID=UPI0013683EC2|nr:VCBS repeat-containing protein [Pontixanthobacter aquaemixtae]